MSRRPAPPSTPNLVSQLALALRGLWRILTGSRQAGKFNGAQLLAQFAQVEQLLASGDSIHAAQAVVQADSLLDSVMKQAGASGTSFADRLRSLEPRLSKDLYQHIWNAHKLRNQIAHEHPQVSVSQARSALEIFRRAASQLGAF